MIPDTATIPSASAIVLPPDKSFRFGCLKLVCHAPVSGYPPVLFLSDKNLTLIDKSVKWEFCISGITKTNGKIFAQIRLKIIAVCTVHSV